MTEDQIVFALKTGVAAGKLVSDVAKELETETPARVMSIAYRHKIRSSPDAKTQRRRDHYQYVVADAMSGPRPLTGELQW